MLKTYFWDIISRMDTTPFLGIQSSSLFTKLFSCSSSFVETLSLDGRLMHLGKVSSLDNRSNEINFSFFVSLFRSNEEGIRFGILNRCFGARRRGLNLEKEEQSIVLIVLSLLIFGYNYISIALIKI